MQSSTIVTILTILVILMVLVMVSLRPNTPLHPHHLAARDSQQQIPFEQTQDNIKTLMRLGIGSDYNHYRWSVIKRALIDDRNGDVSSDLVVMDYCSALGSISMATSITFPLSHVISMESKDYVSTLLGTSMSGPSGNDYIPEEAQILGAPEYHRRLAKKLDIPNNHVCENQFKPHMLASLRITGILFDVQIMIGCLDNLPLNNYADLQAMLSSLVKLAYVTIIEVPPATQPHVREWYQKAGSASQIVELALQHQSNVEVTTLVNHRGEGTLIQVSRTDLDLQNAPVGPKLCEEVSSLFSCARPLDSSECSTLKHAKHKKPKVLTPAPSNRQDEEKVVKNAKPVKQETPVKLRKIPRDLCGKGKITELISDCPRAPRSEWKIENDGYYKCRTETHWLSGCLRYS